MKDILIGRDEEDTNRYGYDGTAFLGKHYVKTGDEINLSGRVVMDLARPHVILVCGKRGQGKSYTLGTIAEEISFLPEKLRRKMAVLIFDTMGIFWTMKFPNLKDKELLEKWGLEPKGIETNLLVPHGFAEQFGKSGIPVDAPFSLRLSELSSSDLCMTFGLDQYSNHGILIERVVKWLQENKQNYGLNEMIDAVRNAKFADPSVRAGVENRLIAAEQWGLFHEKGTPLKTLLKPGKVNILDISPYSSAIGGWSVRALVVGLLVRKIFRARMLARKIEEKAALSSAEHPLYSSEGEEADVPMTWFILDEAHELMPRVGETPATEPLLQLIREGRQPGLTLVAATQQPGKIHTDMMSQCDLVLAHRVTAVPDIEALNTIMSNYMVFTLEKYMASLPRVKGSGILLDDNSEKVYAIRTRPRLTWHGGESATVIREKMSHGEV